MDSSGNTQLHLNNINNSGMNRKSGFYFQESVPSRNSLNIKFDDGEQSEYSNTSMMD